MVLSARGIRSQILYLEVHSTSNLVKTLLLNKLQPDQLYLKGLELGLATVKPVLSALDFQLPSWLVF